MKNHETELKLQAYLDGELAGPEAAELEALLANDKEAGALLGELRATKSALQGGELARTLPESRDFFWSKIEQEISRPEPMPVAAFSLVQWFRRYAGPLGSVALACCLIGVFVVRSRHGGALSAETDISSDEVSSYTFHDPDEKMTMVWFSDHDDGSTLTEPPVDGIKDP